jgi:hypothetical protein
VKRVGEVEIINVLHANRDFSLINLNVFLAILLASNVKVLLKTNA